MIDFQAAERQRVEEPASEIGLEPLCAMVCEFFLSFNLGKSLALALMLTYYMFLPLTCDKLTKISSIHIVYRLTTICAAMILQWS